MRGRASLPSGVRSLNLFIRYTARMSEPKEEKPQTRMTGEVFELREPQKRDKHLAVEVVQNGVTKRYTCKFGPAFNSEGRTLSEALHQLANKLDAAKVFGSEQYDPEALKTPGRLRLCQYCNAPIFFAKTPNNKWMPVDGDSLDAKEASPMRVFHITNQGGSPHVLSLGPKAEGQVWIAHPDVCGANDTEPERKVPQQRWNHNRKNIALRQDEAVIDLTRIVHDLEDPS